VKVEGGQDNQPLNTDSRSSLTGRGLNLMYLLHYLIQACEGAVCNEGRIRITIHQNYHSI